MINLALPSFQLYVKEREAKLQVDIAYNAYYETILKVIKCSMNELQMMNYSSYSQNIEIIMTIQVDPFW